MSVLLDRGIEGRVDDAVEVVVGINMLLIINRLNWAGVLEMLESKEGREDPLLFKFNLKPSAW